jgi:hypothetical protein
MICMTDDGFVRVVGDKERSVIGEKLIRIIFDKSTIYPIFACRAKKIFSFVSLPSHWPRPPPYAPWPKFDPDFHSENGCWYFVGRSRRPVPVPLPACDFGPGRAQNSLELVLGSKRNPLYRYRYRVTGPVQVPHRQCRHQVSQIKLSRPIWDREEPGTSLPGSLNTPNRVCSMRLGYHYHYHAYDTFPRKVPLEFIFIRAPLTDITFSIRNN